MIPVKYKRIIKEIPAEACNFGRDVALAKLRCIWTDERLDMVQRKNEIILDYLKKNFGYLLDQYQKQNVQTMPAETTPIWVMWWDGAMPEVIELCHRSKKTAAGIHPIILITKKNVRKYISFPDNIWKQFEDGKLRIQHLADMIRVQLIRKYGGLWLDASVYCNGVIPEDFFDVPLYSIRGEDNPRYISHNQWTTFAIGGHPNNILCSFLDDFFQAYCMTGKPFIDYYMFDCAIALAYRNIPAVRKELESLPFCKENIYHLNNWLYQPVGNVDCSQIPMFNKLGWRGFVDDVPEAGSLYQALLKGKSNE